MRFLLILPVLLGLFAGQCAQAHLRSESASRWEYAAGHVSLRFTIAEAGALRLFGDARHHSLPEAVESYLDKRLRPSDEAACRPLRPLKVDNVRNGYLRLEREWRCRRAPASLHVQAFFDIDPEHSHYASYTNGDRFSQKLLRAGQADWRLESPDLVAAPTADTVRANLFVEGVAHILSGVDHIVFLLALLLICGRVKETVWAVTGFTIGHSVSLALAVLGIIRPVVPAIEAAIGLTIVLVALERGLRPDSGSPASVLILSGVLLAIPAGMMIDAGSAALTMLAGMALFACCYLLLAREVGHRPSFRVMATALFGLVHGLGFAGAFMAIDIPASQLASSLLAFNLGVESGQILLIAAFTVAWQLARHVSGLRPILGDAISALTCGAGAYWFVSRILVV